MTSGRDGWRTGVVNGAIATGWARPAATARGLAGGGFAKAAATGASFGVFDGFAGLAATTVPNSPFGFAAFAAVSGFDFGADFGPPFAAGAFDAAFASILASLAAFGGGAAFATGFCFASAFAGAAFAFEAAFTSALGFSGGLGAFAGAGLTFDAAFARGVDGAAFLVDSGGFDAPFRVGADLETAFAAAALGEGLAAGLAGAFAGVLLGADFFVAKVFTYASGAASPAAGALAAARSVIFLPGWAFCGLLRVSRFMTPA